MKYFARFATAFLFILAIAADKQRAIDIGETTAHASTNCAMTTSNTESDVQAAGVAASTNSCTGTSSPSLVQLPAGNINWPSSWNMPCGTNHWTLSGPVVPVANVSMGGYSYAVVTPTAKLTGSIGANYGFRAPSCSTGFTLQYFEWDGGRPSGGGGGFGYANRGASNYTVQYVYAHGFQAVQYQAPQQNETFWYMDGCALNTCSSPSIALNDTFSWNRIGNSDAGDCSAIMNVYQYVPDNTNGSNYAGNIGGYCGTLGINSYTTNFTANNNNWFHIEQAGKCYEAEGGAPYYAFLHRNFMFQYNDFTQVHRIGFESQCAPVYPSTMTFDSNSIHDQFYGGYGSWPLSLPQSGGSPGSGGGQTVSTNNVMMSNLSIPNVPSNRANCYQFSSASSCYSGSSTGGYFFPACIEGWGPANMGHNLCQSAITNGIHFLYSPGCTTGGGTANYNIVQSTGFTVLASGQEQCSGGALPTQTGNATSTTVSARQSAAPSISVSGNVVTITSNGYTGTTTVGPLGNTSAYYTTDGSTPTTGSTFCGYSCSFSAANGTTVNVIGMWGAQNQPKSYAPGYGFTPSKVVSALVSGGTAPTLTGVVLSLTGGGNSVQVSNSVQAIATCQYTGGITTNCTSGDVYGKTAGSWVSSNTSAATITNTGSVAGVAVGSSNLTVSAGGFTSPAFAVSVTSIAPVLQSIQNSCTDSIAVGQAGTCSCAGTYTNQTNGSCPSVSYASGSPGVATVNSSTGALLGISPGTSLITAMAGGFQSTDTVTVTSNTPPAATLLSTLVSCSPNYVYTGYSLQCHASANYSDGTQTDCTTMDAQGTLCTGWVSSSPGVATVNSTGLVTGASWGITNISVTSPAVTTIPAQFVVAVPPSGSTLGNTNYNTPGTTYPNYINATYAVTGPSVSTVSSCSFYLPTGYTYPTGGKIDCGLIFAPTPTTQATSWLCHSTYIATGTSSDYGWHSNSITGCGNLSPSSAWWVAVDTNISGPTGEGAWNCGSSCTGSAPTVGNGTYPCSFISATYGTYTGMGSAMTLGCGPSGTQGSQYVTLASPSPTMVGGYFTAPGLSNTLQVGKTIQLYAVCQYSDSTSYLCSPSPDVYGNTLTSITSSSPSVAKIGAVGSPSAALLQGISSGATIITGTLTGGIVPRQYGETITQNATSLPPATSRALSR